MEQDEIQEEAIARHVFTALGEASVCWSELPTGVFDSTRAKKVGDDLIKFIESLTP